MKKFLKISGFTVVALLVLVVLAFAFRHQLILHIVALVGSSELKPAEDEGPGAEWFDDYFTIFRIDDRTYAIGETRYWQNNFNYLILGDEQAILFDAGPGIRDIRPLLESLTSLPIIFIPSHLHFDHLGNTVTFERVGLIDVPHLRNSAVENNLVPEKLQHYGDTEGIDAPTLHITDWLKPKSSLQLGNRIIEVVYTPGHTRDGISLVDVASQYAFTGDFLVPGPMSEFTYGGGMGDYLQGVNSLLSIASHEARVFGAHRAIFAEKTSSPQGIPEINMQDVRELRNSLVAIRDGEMSGSGLYPVVYTINDNLELWANSPWLQDWTPSYPQFGH